MTTKIKPAQELPWTTNHESVIYSQNKGSQRGAVAEYGYQQDAAYICHTANAYPKLVKALREAADNLAYRGGNERADAYLAILRELGELK